MLLLPILFNSLQTYKEINFNVQNYTLPVVTTPKEQAQLFYNLASAGVHLSNSRAEWQAATDWELEEES